MSTALLRLMMVNEDAPREFFLRLKQFVDSLLCCDVKLIYCFKTRKIDRMHEQSKIQSTDKILLSVYLLKWLQLNLNPPKFFFRHFSGHSLR